MKTTKPHQLLNIFFLVDAPNIETTTDQIDDAQTSNGIKDAVCLVDIPMPSANESQSDTTTSKDGTVATSTNSNQPSPGGETGINSTEEAQNDMQRQFNLITVPPPPPPEHEPKSTFSSNIVISTQRTVNIFLNIHE